MTTAKKTKKALEFVTWTAIAFGFWFITMTAIAQATPTEVPPCPPDYHQGLRPQRSTSSAAITSQEMAALQKNHNKTGSETGYTKTGTGYSRRKQ